ncbi:nucleosome assembly protein 1-like 1 isoform X3 [Camelus ferus]|uniref:Nucleosome assembly protein 1-like 1 isoform X3 n=2 Tax=Camelus TaxID=9836 RepID=A0A8B8UC26_CAMFR|nr:nucleosome assembly protein 1-like 1 [Camelus dromedarius]XP_032352149.1 nucleosome assembly protein 1-like 1 isoform X3 [Camelus ferus]XP_045378360.1 nucleosome assembly protein 1-like 1 [Camelus bactrianus]
MKIALSRVVLKEWSETQVLGLHSQAWRIRISETGIQRSVSYLTGEATEEEDDDDDEEGEEEDEEGEEEGDKENDPDCNSKKN